jgi:hypothetical protein
MKTEAVLNSFPVICTTLVFIQEVTKASPSSPSASANLAEAHGFLEAFSDLCFGDVTGLLRDARVAQCLGVDIYNSLHSLNKVLAAHREAWRYINVASEVNRHPTGRQRASTIALDVDGQKKIWREEMKHRSQLWREKSGAGVHSVLFEPEEMEILHCACDAWIGRLRHTLCIVLLVSGDPSPHHPTNECAVRLGIAHMLERQRRLGLRPSENYRPLSGQLRKSVSSLQPVKSLMKTVYVDLPHETDVVVEVRPYSDTPAGSVRQLAWYLGASSAVEIPAKQSETSAGYDMLTLACLGYMDDPSNARSLILYRSPRSHPWASDPPSLHEVISKGWTSKMSLSHRFKAARTLVSSVLDIHTSGSLHSNINSNGIAMLPRNLNDPEPSPYLLGWGVEASSPDTMSTLEPNLYRHRTQFGRTPQPSTTEQDIYSLGVVLLEIGLWTTMSTVFAKLLETAPRFGPREEKAVFKKVNRVILDLGYSSDLRKEMGERYAAVVKACLEWNHEDAVESMLDFRKRIVDALDVGCRL